VGIKIAGWQERLLQTLQMKGIAAELYTANDDVLLKFQDSSKLVLNLIPYESPLNLQAMLDLASSYREQDILLVQLWEDIWLTRPLQVLSRICSMLGKNKTVHGRKTKIVSVSQPQADVFFERFHLQASANARYKYALTLEDEIIAVATFSAKRNMTKKAEEGYTSVELIRFATADGITVQGGLSKLIKHLIKTISPNDVMTYTDMDWSNGKGYIKLGFEPVATSAPAEIWLNTINMNRYFPHRLPEEIRIALNGLDITETESYMKSMNYRRICNTGNLKYILYL
jgi:hypothetical protein